MKSGAFLLAVLLGVFLAVGQCGNGSANEDGDHSSASSVSDDHDDDSDDSGDKDKDEKDKKEDKKDSEKKDEKKDDDKKKDKDDDGKDKSVASAMKDRLKDQGLTVVQMSSTSNDDCAKHSYGHVAEYFADHPCEGLQRAWYEVRDDGDNAAVLSVAWVEMSGAEAADDLKALVDRTGTGNVTELTKEDGPYRYVRYSGWYYRSDRDGDTFQSVQAEPLAGNQGSRDVARQAAGATAPD